MNELYNIAKELLKKYQDEGIRRFINDTSMSQEELYDAIIGFINMISDYDKRISKAYEGTKDGNA